MDDNKTINTLLNAEIPPSADNALKNLTDKPSLSIEPPSPIYGILYLVVYLICPKRKKIEYAHKLDLYREELEESIKQISPEKVTEPSIQITAQALENSKYCVDEDELRQMFTALISNSMNTDFSKDVHPSFAEILKQMSVLDAEIVHLFKQEKNPSISLPVCQYCLSSEESITCTSFFEHIFLELPDIDLQLCSMSLSSLCRLGIVSISYTKWLTTPNTYDKFLTHPLYLGLKENTPFGMTPSLKKGVVELTPLGRSFIKVCVPD